MPMTITIADGRGELWQWDTGRSLRVGSGVEQIHYQNKYFGRSVDVDVGADGTAIIPDELLQDCHPLTAYAYVTDDSGGYTKVQQEFIVNRRAKPAGYTYTPTDQMTLKAIQLQIGDLADLTTEAKDTLVAAINEVALMGGRMSLRVADGYIQYSTDSGSTWKNLIAVSELKGSDATVTAANIAGALGYTPASPGDIPVVPTAEISANTAARHSHANKGVLDGITAEKTAEWDGKSSFSGRYEDLTGKPTAIKNPNALTIKIGSATVTYDGSTTQTVTIDDGTEVKY